MKSDYCEDFVFEERGLIHMKNKGDMLMYFLEAAEENNAAVNAKALQQLDEEVKQLLQEKSFDKRRAQLQRVISARAMQQSLDLHALNEMAKEDDKADACNESKNQNTVLCQQCCECGWPTKHICT